MACLKGVDSLRSRLLAASAGKAALEIRSARGAEMLRKGMCRTSAAVVLQVLKSDAVFLWDAAADDGVHGLVVKNPDVTVVAAWCFDGESVDVVDVTDDADEATHCFSADDE